MSKDFFNLSHISRMCSFPLQVTGVAVYQRNDYILENMQPEDSYLSFIWKTEFSSELSINGSTVQLDSPYMAVVTPEDTVRLLPQTSREETFFKYRLHSENLKLFNLQNCFFRMTPQMENLRSELNQLLHSLYVPGNADRIDMLALQMAQEAMLNKLDRCHHTGQMLPDERIFKVARRIEMYFDTEFDIDKEIRQVGLGRRTFYREWNKFFMDTPKKYLLDLRFNKAKQLLVYTKKSIAEIAELCGFSNAAYFIHVFGENFGVTPGAFRKNSSKNLL
jgi:AraC-like DNA-binding protein